MGGAVKQRLIKGSSRGSNQDGLHELTSLIRRLEIEIEIEIEASDHNDEQEIVM